MKSVSRQNPTRNVLNGMECGGWNVLARDPSSASRLRGTEEQSHNLIQHLSDYTCKNHIIRVYFFHRIFGQCLLASHSVSLLYFA